MLNQFKRLVSIAALAIVAGCGGGGGSSSQNTASIAPSESSSIPVNLASNAVLVTVDSGPQGRSFNVPFVSVTVCRPGTSVCQTIDHVMVDTASYGLRLMSSVVAPALGLPAISGNTGGMLAECGQFVSGYTWGSVRRADVTLGGEQAPGLPVQIIGDVPGGSATIPATCTSTGRSMSSVGALGANGILGVGNFNHDCGIYCTYAAGAGLYYDCMSSGCLDTVVPLANQIANPVAAFAINNNGVALTLPNVPRGGASRVRGTLVFGIGTQPNNQLGGATVYKTDSGGSFTTVYNGKTLASSFLDSGSNGLFFNDASIPKCSTGFYCPTSTLSLSAMNMSADGSSSGMVNFTVESMRSLYGDAVAANVGGTLSDPSGDSTMSDAFDWGLPFFFGRTVFVAIQGTSTPGGTGPYWAY